jgi:hypothetical protein
MAARQGDLGVIPVDGYILDGERAAFEGVDQAAA